MLPLITAEQVIMNCVYILSLLLKLHVSFHFMCIAPLSDNERPLPSNQTGSNCAQDLPRYAVFDHAGRHGQWVYMILGSLGKAMHALTEIPSLMYSNSTWLKVHSLELWERTLILSDSPHVFIWCARQQENHPTHFNVLVYAVIWEALCRLSLVSAWS